MKLGLKLSLGFAVTILLLLIIVIFSIINMAKLNDGVHLLTNDRFPKTVWANNVIDNINEGARALRNAIITIDMQDRDKQIERLLATTPKAKAALDSLHRTILSKEGQAILQKIDDVRPQYIQTREKLINIIRAGELDKARELLFGEFRQLQTEYFAGVNELIGYQTKLFAESGVEADNIYDSAFMIQIILAIIALLASIVTAFVITRMITKPISRAVTASDSISKGDLKVDLSSSSKDETGQLLSAMKIMSNTIDDLVKELNTVATAATEGKLDKRANEAAFEGEYKSIMKGFNNTLDAVIGPLNVTAEYVDRISKGDIPPKITDEYKGDFNEIKNNLNTCIDAVNLLVKDAMTLSKAAKEGKLDTRADASKHGGDFRAIVQGVNDTLDNVIGPLNVAAEYVDRIAKGDIPPKITDNYNGDFNEIKNNLNQCIDAVNMLVADAGMLAKAAVEGKLDTRADASKHGGDFRAIVQGVNNTLDNVIGPLNVAAEYVDRIAKGDIPPKITDNYNGDFNEIKNNLNQCIDAVNLLVADAGMLAKAAVEGKLDTRADASKHGGDFRAIVQGVNNTLDNVIGPLNVAAEYVDRIAKGDIPPKITDNYNGDFNEIKNNLNQCIDAVNLLVADAGLLAKAAVEGKLDTRADASKHGGDFRAIVQGVNNTLDNVIGPLNVAAEYVDRIAKGDIPPKITDNYNGDFNEIKNNLNQCIDAVNLLVADAGMLVQAAIDEKFDTRANAQKHSGDFRKIVEGVNKTLDVVVNKIFWFEQLLDAIPSPISVTDLDMNWTFINKAAEGVAGKKRKEVLGNHCSNWGADICGTEKCGVHGLRKGKATSFFNQPGLNMDFKVDTAYILDAKGDKIGHIEVVTDVTESTQKAQFNKIEVQKLANNLKLLSEGNLGLDFTVADANQYTKEDRDNFVIINNNFEIAKNAISNLVKDAAMLARAAIDGKLDTRADASKHQGDFREIVQGVNNTLDNVIGPLNVAAEYVDRIAKGDIPPKITDNYNGDFNEIKNNLNQCIDAVNMLVADAAMLAKAAVEGKLATRADAGKHGGDFRAIVQGFNNTLDNVIGPLNVAADYVDKISKGNIPAKITDNYNGDFNIIKNNLNTCIDAVNRLVADAVMLAKAAADGKLQTRADASKHNGDFREIVEGVNQTLDGVINPLNEAAEVLKQMATGDLTARMMGNYKGDMEAFKEDINTLGESLAQLITQVNDAVQSSASSAVEISATAESLAAASQEQSAQADEVASAVEEMSRTVTENAMSANRTADVARANGQVANEGAGVVKQTVTKMRDIADVVKNSAMNIQKLGDSSKQIGEIISVIDDIADQTNLLALNAAIEAARAGEQGRGFAVVADEVRKLAERTTEATKQIASMIKGIQSETEQAVTAMNKGTHEVQSGIELADRAGESLNNILTSTQEVLDMINQIAAASEQQSATSEQISKNVMSISKVTGESAQRIEDVAKTSDELAKMTEHLRELMGQFQVEEETTNKGFNTRHLSHSPKKQLGSRLR